MAVSMATEVEIQPSETDWFRIRFDSHGSNKTAALALISSELFDYCSCQVFGFSLLAYVHTIGDSFHGAFLLHTYQRGNKNRITTGRKLTKRKCI